MKHTSASNRIFVNRILLSVALFFLIPWSVAFAADVSLLSQTISGTNVTIKVKFGDPTIIQDANIYLYLFGGQTLGFDTKGQPKTDGTYTETIGGLQKGKKYDLNVQYLKNGVSQTVGVGSVDMTTPPPTAPTPPAPTVKPDLPVTFVTNSTVIGNGAVTFTVSNSNTSDFQIEVFATVTGGTGSVADSRGPIVVTGGTTGQIAFTGLEKDKVYDFKMIGKKVGAPNYSVYQEVFYNGLKLSSTATTTTTTTPGATPAPSTPFVPGVGSTSHSSSGNGTCGDGLDNDIPPDGKRDWDGVRDAAGQPQYPPDPSCINRDQTEAADDVAAGSLIPCTNKCDLPAVFVFLNKMIESLIKVALLPIAILMFVYAGYKYITAQGNPSKTANIKRMIKHLILGIVIILTAWLAVKTALVLIGYDQALYFFSE